MAFLAPKVAALEARAANLESMLGGSAGGDVKPKLEQLMALLEEDRKEADQVAAQRDELLKENSKLKEQVDKLNYRVQHLLRALAATDK